MPKTPSELRVALKTIVQRIPERADTRYHADILAKLQEWELAANEPPAADFANAWRAVKETGLTAPQFFYFLFRNLAGRAPELLEAVRRQWFEADIAGREPFYGPDRDWVAIQSDDGNPDSFFAQLVDYLALEDFKHGRHFEYYSIYLPFVDLLYSHFVRPELKAVQADIYQLLFLQSLNWPNAYCNGSAYQGSSRVGVGGIKPNEARMALYDIDGLLHDRQKVLDIGSNMGLMALHLAQRCGHVDAVEYNPYLCQIGRRAADALSIRNVSFVCNDFLLYAPQNRYDVVVSLANHATIDQRLSATFKDYIQKIYSLMNAGGYLFFESHNVFGPGKGGPGDDGDLDLKLDLAAPFFDIVKYRMVPAFVSHHDVDKLFVVMKRRPAVDGAARRVLSRSDAIKRYHYGT